MCALSTQVAVRIDSAGYTKENCKSLFAGLCLWIAYLMCNMAFSIIAPFFPNEVSGLAPTYMCTSSIQCVGNLRHSIECYSF